MRKRPMFTKRHHEALARIVAQADATDAPDHLLLSALCTQFERDNPAFNRCRWLDLVSRARYEKAHTYV